MPSTTLQQQIGTDVQTVLCIMFLSVGQRPPAKAESMEGLLQEGVLVKDQNSTAVAESVICLTYI